MQSQSMMMEGYVTTWASVAGQPEAELEARLGFAPGSLRNGYSVYVLAEFVALNEFEWKDRTAYSDGWHFDPSVTPFKDRGDSRVYGVQRFDELRAHLGKVHGYNDSVVDKEIDRIMRMQLTKLNIRVGNERIVKVRPKFPGAVFPPSSFRNIPQWRLTVPKRFLLDAGSFRGQG